MYTISKKYSAKKGEKNVTFRSPCFRHVWHPGRPDPYLETTRTIHPPECSAYRRNMAAETARIHLPSHRYAPLRRLLAGHPQSARLPPCMRQARPRLPAEKL